MKHIRALTKAGRRKTRLAQINVERLFAFVEKSIREGMKHINFDKGNYRIEHLGGHRFVIYYAPPPKPDLIHIDMIIEPSIPPATLEPIPLMKVESK